MKRWRTKLAFLSGVAALGLAIPAFSQNAQAPEAVVPPGFGGDPDPVPPPPSQEPTPAEGQGNQATAAPRGGDADIRIISAGDEDLAALEDLHLPPAIEIPDFARRPIDVVGPLGPGNWGLGQGAFGGANGRFLSSLMRRVDAPLPSRWESILLRRALLSHVPAPSYVHPVDWVAERAWLLLRMGEADGARMLVQSVDVDEFTPKMFSVAVQTALATADPAALCPLVGPGRKTSDEPVWPLSDAICASLAGQASRAGQLIDQARRRGTARGIDLLLAEKVIGAGANTRRAVTIQWDEVDALNAWRFGLAASTGAEIPARLINATPLQMRAWYARAPMISLDQRVDAAETAATLGVFSNASLVDMYSLLTDAADVTEIAGSVGDRLRTAYSDRNTNKRLDAMKQLWGDGKNPTSLYARQILTAVAASRLTPSDEYANDAPKLIASMLSAGLDRDAARWIPIVEGMDGADQARAWALLAVGAPRPIDASSAWIGRYQDNDDSAGDYKTKLLFAALAGLGRIGESDQASLADDMEVQLKRNDRWARMLDAAARARQPGTVALLSAAAMQTSHWRGVPPGDFYRIVRALKQVGLEYEARMIAAEAISRG